MTLEQIKAKITKTFPDASVAVEDLTGTMDHIQVLVETSKFNGMPLLERHRTIMALFDSELKSGEIHALTIKAKEKK